MGLFLSLMWFRLKCEIALDASTKIVEERRVRFPSASVFGSSNQMECEMNDDFPDLVYAIVGLSIMIGEVILLVLE